MRIIKIIPCLDMKDGRMVKRVHFVDLKDAGPVKNVTYYQQEGADKLAMLDIATVENRKTKLEWVKNASAVIDVPLTMGGGISTSEDIEKVLPPALTRSDESAAPPHF
jgi:cyclase